MPSSSSLIEQKLIMSNALFAFSKSLLRYEQLDSAISDYMNTLMRVVQGQSYTVCSRARSDLVLRYIAVGSNGDDQSIKKALIGQEVRIGSIPCGLALEADEFVQKAIGDELLLEIPARHARFIAYVLSLRCVSRTDLELLNLAASSLKNAAQLLEEFLSLRARLAEKMEIDRGRESREAYSSAEESVVSWHGIVGNSGPMREMFSMLEKVANTDASVLLLGESGTGKELIAQAIHQKSFRAGAPFIAVNCGALPESVIESELFGHEKGSFTGAYDQRKGRFEIANNGTLFLDEIGELSPATQIKLLRFLQNHRFERVGGNASIEANVRVIAATNRNLQEAVDRGSFRADLYYRLNVFPVSVPPLRERGADILLLADHFVALFNASNDKKIQRISTPALDLLMIYHWPGNVRELENCILRAAILSTDGVIHAYNLPPSLQSAESTNTAPSTGLDAAISRLEKELIVEALKLENGNIAATARRLVSTERRVRYAIQRYKIDPKRYKTKL